MSKTDKNGQKMQTVHVALSKDCIRHLKDMAADQGRSLAAQVAWIVRRYLDR